MFGPDPLDELAIPDGTHVREHDLVTDGDVLVGGQSVVELGVRGSNIVAGERVQFGGDIEADGDCRLDMWCEVDGNVLVGEDAYLGERVHITGQLIVSGDLDIGDDVDIEEGFEANGWIVIRNPMPTIVFLFVYLSHLLRMGDEEAAEEVAEEFLTDDQAADPVVIPRGGRVSDDAWRVSTPATIGDDCRLHGNIRATDIEVGTATEVFGSLRAKGDIRIGDDTVVHGDVTTKDGDVAVAPGVRIRGDISCEACTLSEAADVEGTIRARDGIEFERERSPSGERGRGAVASGHETTETEAEPEDSPDEPAAKPATDEQATDADRGGAAADDDPGTGSESPEESTPDAAADGSEQPEADDESHERSAAFVPLDTTEPKPAVRSLEEARHDWTDGQGDTTGDGAADTEADDHSDPTTNGVGDDDVSAVVTDTEES
ncbi:DUF583 domain protein [Natronomonas pharaonis DSM 2160]|uniref:DUF583 domain protein n=1 Tax=Natronomonas pharaonis (strain ATCC 35678 / DSM 2160 / CIP 103997 / JCM 8858 / NBRC 14720 / NCIMB 2260 / Gabara) TaxID=348780 RepID=A0A1U7EV85_NATPD|nr:DUF583 domain protein [Natronomonas pharaonis DSM 2160]